MTIPAVVLLLCCVGVASLQACVCLKLVAVFRRPAPPLLTDEECPPVLAVLCLRGTDPFLPASLRRLLTLDYPTYRVRVVIDSPADPVRQLVEDARDELDSDHVEILTLDAHDEFCSAKMSSLLMATTTLPPETRIVATFDGDCVLHPSCLRELVTPLVRERAAVSTGNRWFAPQGYSLGGMVRFQWNLACVPLMTQLGLPWGGCLAMQRWVIEDTQVRARYAEAFAEDMLLGSLMRQRGEVVRFVPSATIVNREEISLKGVTNFLTRQMLCVRLHHHQWQGIVAWCCLITVLGSVVCPIGLLIPTLRLACAIGLVLLVIGNLLPMVLMGAAIRRIVGERGESLLPVTAKFITLNALAALPTEWITLIANIRAIMARPITWRGLTYQFARSPRVRLIQESPIGEPADVVTYSPMDKPHRDPMLEDSTIETSAML